MSLTSHRIGELRAGRVVESDGRPETGSDSGRRTDSCSGKEAASGRSEELR